MSTQTYQKSYSKKKETPKTQKTQKVKVVQRSKVNLIPKEITGEKREEIIQTLNKIGFLADVYIALVDKLAGTSVYNQSLKACANRLLIELERANEFQYTAYKKYGLLPNNTEEEIRNNPEKIKMIHSLDVFKITSKAYDEMFKFFTETKASDVVILLEYLKRLNHDELKDIGVDFVPLRRSSEELLEDEKL